MFNRVAKKTEPKKVFTEGYISGIATTLTALSAFGYDLDANTRGRLFEEMGLDDSARAEIMETVYK